MWVDECLVQDRVSFLLDISKASIRGRTIPFIRSYITMPLYAKLPADLKEVDVIIAGGGLAGCVVAGRLAEADPQLSILVIEQGEHEGVARKAF